MGPSGILFLWIAKLQSSIHQHKFFSQIEFVQFRLRRFIARPNVKQDILFFLYLLWYSLFCRLCSWFVKLKFKVFARLIHHQYDAISDPLYMQCPHPTPQLT